MPLLDGKQIRNNSLNINKISNQSSQGNVLLDTGSMLGVVDSPVLSTDLANKSYVDSFATGLDPKEASRLATTTDLSAVYNSNGGSGTSGQFTSAPITIDGVSINIGDRILVKDQTDPKENGIYVVTSDITIWNRSSDHDGSPISEVSTGNFTFVTEGLTQSASGWIIINDGVTTDNLTLNTNNINWSRFSGSMDLEQGKGIVFNGTKIESDIDNSTLIFDQVGDGGKLQVNLAVPDPSQIAINNTNGLIINKSDISNILTFGNGLEGISDLNGNKTINLGGSLSQDTTIEGNDNAFSLGTPSNRLDRLSFYSDNTITFESILSSRSSEIKLRGNRLDLFSINTTTSTEASVFIDGDFLDIVFSNGNSEKGLLIDESDFSFVDDINNFGAKYDSDYSVNGVLDDRWIPDYGAVKNYVDNIAEPSGLNIRGSFDKNVNTIGEPIPNIDFEFTSGLGGWFSDANYTTQINESTGSYTGSSIALPPSLFNDKTLYRIEFNITNINSFSGDLVLYFGSNEISPIPLGISSYDLFFDNSRGFSAFIFGSATFESIKISNIIQSIYPKNPPSISQIGIGSGTNGEILANDTWVVSNTYDTPDVQILKDSYLVALKDNPINSNDDWNIISEFTLNRTLKTDQKLSIEDSIFKIETVGNKSSSQLEFNTETIDDNGDIISFIVLSTTNDTNNPSSGGFTLGNISDSMREGVFFEGKSTIGYSGSDGATNIDISRSKILITDTINKKGASYEQTTLDNIDWATDDLHIPSIGLIKDNIPNGIDLNNFTNGITEITSGTFGLGGSLSQDTIIDQQGFNYNWNDISLIEPDNEYLKTVGRVNVDGETNLYTESITNTGSRVERNLEFDFYETDINGDAIPDTGENSSIEQLSGRIRIRVDSDITESRQRITIDDQLIELLSTDGSVELDGGLGVELSSGNNRLLISDNRSIIVNDSSEQKGIRYSHNQHNLDWSSDFTYLPTIADIIQNTVPLAVNSNIRHIYYNNTWSEFVAENGLSFESNLHNNSTHYIKLGGSLNEDTELLLNQSNTFSINTGAIQIADKTTQFNISKGSVRFSTQSDTTIDGIVDTTTSFVSDGSQVRFNYASSSTGSSLLKSLIMNSSSILIQDDINSFGAKYDSDYSANGILNDRWIPDYGAVKNYVNSSINTSSLSINPNSTNLLEINNGQLEIKPLAITSVTVDDTVEPDFNTWYTNNYTSITPLEEGDVLILTSINGVVENYIHNGGISNSLSDFTKLNNDNISDSYVRSLLSASNGITYEQTSGNFKLGGSLNEDTTIDTTDNLFVLQSSPVSTTIDRQSTFSLNSSNASHVISYDSTGDGTPDTFHGSLIDSNSASLFFSNSDGFNSLNVTEETIRINTGGSLAGARYGADYSVNGISNHGDRWIPDYGAVNSAVKNYVDSTKYVESLSNIILNNVYTITHNLFDFAILVTIWDENSGEIIYPNISNRTLSTVDVTFIGSVPNGNVSIIIKK